jgi:parvulin-like peptidyl-prolyl isomerase
VTSLRRLSPLALAGLLLFAAACSDSADPALTVNGVEVSQEDIDAEIEALVQYAEDNPEVAFDPSPSGQGDGTVNAAFTAQVLTERVIALVVDEEFEDRGLELTDDQRQAAEEAFASQLAQDPAEGQEIFDSFPEEFQEFEITFNAQRDALREELSPVTDEDVQAFYEENGDLFRENCVSHILVADEATATDLRAQIEGGADFATVAEESSTDQASAVNGGELGCQPPGSYVPEFEEAVAAAEIGEVTEPVQTDFGFHLILVTDSRTVPLEEVADQIRQQLQGGEDPIDAVLQEAVGEADIEVNPRYGSWDEEALQVVPPEGATTTTTEPPPGVVPGGTVPVDTLPVEPPPTTAAP